MKKSTSEMNNGFICLLLILLVSEVIHCQIECPEGQSSSLNGKCEDCKYIKQQLLHCQKNCEVTNPDSQGQCKIKCETMKNYFQADCEKYFCTLIDKRIFPNKCLQYYSECSDGLVSSNGKDCVKKCLSHQLKVDFKKFIKCQGCHNNTSMTIVENKKVCVKSCNSYEVFDLTTGKCIEEQSCSGYLTTFKRHCVESCYQYSGIYTKGRKPLKECSKECSFLQYELKGKSYCVDECPQDYLTDEGKGRCRKNENECPIAVSVDGKHCVESCDPLKKETIELKKCTVCTDYWSPNQKSCKKSCSQVEITDKANQLCYTFKYQCSGFISSDGTQCLLSCDPKNKETSILQGDANVFTQYKQCVVCSDFYYADEVVNKSTCKPFCDDDKIVIIPLKKCTKDIADCQNYYISADKRSCSTQCSNANDVLKNKNCIKEEDCLGENEIIDQTTDQKECKDKTAVGYSCAFESEDGRRCVKACSLIKQVESTNMNSQKKCEKCKHPLQFKLTSQNGQDIGICYQIEENNSNNTGNQTSQDLDRLKPILDNLTRIINSTETSKLKTLISPFIDFFGELQKEEQLKLALNVVHEAGSRNNILVFLQIIPQKKRLQKQFLIDNMMKEMPLDLTEQDPSIINSRNSGIVFTIISHNPNSKQDEAGFNFPVVFVTVIDLDTQERLPINDQNLEVVFTSKQQSYQQECQNYDDTITQIIKTIKPKIIGLDIICPFDGITSVGFVNTKQMQISNNNNETDSQRTINASLRPGGILFILLFQVVVCMFIS